jgi:hypothetical protein
MLFPNPFLTPLIQLFSLRQKLLMKAQACVCHWIGTIDFAKKGTVQKVTSSKLLHSAYSTHTQVAVSHSEGGCLSVWDCGERGLECIRKWTGHKDTVWIVAFDQWNPSRLYSGPKVLPSNEQIAEPSFGRGVCELQEAMTVR